MNVADYFQSYKNYFWLWEDDAEVASISGGSTIGYKQQIAEYLSLLANNGLPPFGSFLLLMIATNKTMDNSLGFVKSLLAKNFASFDENYFQNHSEEFNEAFDFLKVVSKIHSSFKTGKRKSILLQTVFVDCHNKLNVTTSNGIVHALKNNNKRHVSFLTKKDITLSYLKKEIRVLHLLLRKFPTVQSIIDAMGDLPEIEEEEISFLENNQSTGKIYKDFVEELEDTPQTFQLGVLIKPIWAGFKIPIFNSHPSEQPLGGVSDLSNRGSFDRLLVSEFANDDLLFMSRLANNEALYLHREMPPITDKMDRVILIDVSLNAWGTPKTLAHAIYLAISKHPKHINEANAYVVGNNYESIKHNNVGEIIDGLQKVEATLNASLGLAAFFADNKNNKLLEIFFITTSESLKHVDVQKQLIEHNTAFKYIITTNKKGEIDFYSNKKNARKHLQTIKLPLEKLWSQGDRKLKEQPIVTAKKYTIPFLLAKHNKIKRTMPLLDDVYIIANKSLFKTNIESNKNYKKGWELLYKNLPANGIYEVGKNVNGDIELLIFNPQTKELKIVNLTTYKTAYSYFSYWRGQYFNEFLFSQDQFIYLVNNPNAFSFEPNYEKEVISTQEAIFSNKVFSEEYEKRQKEIREAFNNSIHFNFLKNVSSVFIDKNNFLFFNRFNLIPNNGYNNKIYLDMPNGIVERNIEAEYKRTENKFLFKDGSSVYTDTNGYFVLKSSNEEIPSIYITSVLQVQLGMATNDYFAGNEFFYNNNLENVSVILNDRGTNPIAVIKIIKEFSGLGLAEAKTIVDSAPKIISSYISYTDAKKMIEALTAIGADAIIKGKTGNGQNIITPEKFYQNFIDKFIQHIVNHATSN
jgi:ribosomal protein L7/L12